MRTPPPPPPPPPPPDPGFEVPRDLAELDEIELVGIEQTCERTMTELARRSLVATSDVIDVLLDIRAAAGRLRARR